MPTAWRSSPKRSAHSRTGLIFANLVDFDMLYGHRKDVEGFARSLEEFDALLGPFLERAGRFGSADDHRRSRLRSRSRESHDGPFARIRSDSGLQPAARAAAVNLGIARTLADMGQTVAENFGGEIPHGDEFSRVTVRQLRVCGRTSKDWHVERHAVGALKSRTGRIALTRKLLRAGSDFELIAAARIFARSIRCGCARTICRGPSAEISCTCTVRKVPSFAALVG